MLKSMILGPGCRSSLRHPIANDYSISILYTLRERPPFCFYRYMLVVAVAIRAPEREDVPEDFVRQPAARSARPSRRRGAEEARENGYFRGAERPQRCELQVPGRDRGRRRAAAITERPKAHELDTGSS